MQREEAGSDDNGEGGIPRIERQVVSCKLQQLMMITSNRSWLYSAAVHTHMAMVTAAAAGDDEKKAIANCGG